MSTETVTAIDFLRSKGLDPFRRLADGRLAWMALDELASARADDIGLVPVVTDRAQWHDGINSMAQVVEWVPMVEAAN